MRSGFLFALPCVLWAATAAADPEITATSSQKIIAVDPALIVPVGDWSNGAGIGFGALGRLDVPIQSQPKLTLTGRMGLVYHLSASVGGGGGAPSTDVSTFEVPILGGGRWVFSETASGGKIYGGAELGFTWIHVSTSSGGMSQSDSNTKFAMTLRGGYRTGKMDLSAGLFMPDVGNATGIMATLGYDVSAL